MAMFNSYVKLSEGKPVKIREVCECNALLFRSRSRQSRWPLPRFLTPGDLENPSGGIIVKGLEGLLGHVFM